MTKILSIEEQQKVLDTSITLIKGEIYLMRKCFETKHKFMDSLKHASNFLNELRTNQLNPKQYYELYILCYDGLNYLTNYLKDNLTKDSNYLIELYELVQYSGNIVPRLYLMISIGSVYMSLEDSPVNEILNDMLEMCKGVQNPIRGLFLRYYIVQKSKKYLIEIGNSSTENLKKIINFIILNFVEMNKLWVRLQHQGHSSEKNKRIEERNELKILVGSNLVILSQLDLINEKIFNFEILPSLLQQIIRCNDSLAQHYLLDVIIQIFPDNFQIFSLKNLLKCFLNINSDVNINVLIISLINRLIECKRRNENINDDKNFCEFISFIKEINNKPEINLKDYCNILSSILRLVVTYEQFGYLNEIYGLTIEKFNQENNKDKEYLVILKSIENFENDNFGKFFQINDDNYFKLFEVQPIDCRNEIMNLILGNLIDNDIKIDDDEKLNFLFKYLNQSILKDIPKKEKSITKTDLFGDEIKKKNTKITEMTMEYELLNKFLHLIYNKDSEKYLALLLQAEKYLMKGNHYLTIPTVISILINLIRKMKLEGIVEDKELLKIFNKVLQLNCSIKDELSLKSLNLNLLCAEISNECGFDNISYEFFIESFIIFEEEIFESKLQFQSLMNITNKLILMDSMIVNDIESYDKLIMKCALYGSRLMKKTDQCRAIYNSSHLWWVNKNQGDEGDDEDDDAVDLDLEEIMLKKDEKRVLECLQKSLRIADSILDSNVSIELFIEILNQSVYYFIHGNSMINVRYLNGLIELISNNFKEVGTDGDYEHTYRHYERTLKYIREQRAVDGRFHEVAI